jgi:hypothetical protein
MGAALTMIAQGVKPSDILSDGFFLGLDAALKYGKFPYLLGRSMMMPSDEELLRLTKAWIAAEREHEEKKSDSGGGPSASR